MPKSRLVPNLKKEEKIGVLKKKPIKDEGSENSFHEDQRNGSVAAINPLGSEFKLTSEYFEKNIVLPDGLLSQKGRPVTQVKIFRESGIDVIDPLDLKSVIKETKDIKQVVVEKISVDEATRVSLLFEPKERNKQLLSLLEEEHLEEIENTDVHKVFSLDEMENLVNEDFLKVNKKEEPTKNSTVDESENVLSFKFPKEETETEEKIEVVSEESTEPPTQATFIPNLKLKTEDQDKTVKYQKHTFTRKKAKAGHSYYYRAKDHVELYKVGSSYLKDFKSGLRSFSFSSKGLNEEREKTVLGILSFFNYHQDVNVCVITSNLYNSFYEKIAKDFQEKEENVFDEDIPFKFFTGDGFDAVEFQELRKIERKLISYNFEDFLDFLMSRYDIILWDLPEREVLDSNKELFFPIIRSLDNVSFIVGKNTSKISEINEQISYFNRYQIPIKGLLFSDSHKGGRS